MDQMGLVLVNNIKNKYLITYNKSNIPKYIDILLEYNNLKYKSIIIENSDWWNMNKYKFNNDFNKCYELFDEILIKENELFTKEIEIINNGNGIILVINYNNKLIPFNISFIFNKITKKIKNNKKKFDVLVQQEIYLFIIMEIIKVERIQNII